MADHLTVRALRALLADLPDKLPVVVWNPAAACFDFAEGLQTGRIRFEGVNSGTKRPTFGRWTAAVPQDTRAVHVVWVRT